MEHTGSPASRGYIALASMPPLELVCIYSHEDEQYFRKLHIVIDPPGPVRLLDFLPGACVRESVVGEPPLDRENCLGVG